MKKRLEDSEEWISDVEDKVVDSTKLSNRKRILRKGEDARSL